MRPLRDLDPATAGGPLGELLTRLTARWLPAPRVALACAVPFLLYAEAAARGAGWLRRARGTAVAYTRKVFHFAVFTAAGAIDLLWGRGAVVFFGTIVAVRVLVAVARAEGDPLYEAMARPGDAPHERLFILVPLVTTALGGVASNLLFPGFAHVGYWVSGWGDAVAEPVGARWGRHPYRVPSLAGVPATRTLEGSASVLIVGGAAAVLALLAVPVSPGPAAAVGLACAVAATVVEAVSNHGVDNFTVQVAASGVAAWLAG